MLVVDIGNTSLRLLRLDGVDSGARPQDIPTRMLAQVSTKLVLSDPVTQLGRIASLADSEEIVVVSVLPDLHPYLRSCFRVSRIIDHQTLFPFAVAMSDIAAVGADRYCNIAAAVYAGWRDALIVDIGTATTFDLLRDGVFTGGLIAPGPGLATRALGEYAARLPEVDFAFRDLRPGLDTIDAMTIGCWQTGLQGICGTIKALLKQSARGPVLLTGGLGHPVHEAFRRDDPGFSTLYDPSWTIKGAALLARGSASTGLRGGTLGGLQ